MSIESLEQLDLLLEQAGNLVAEGDFSGARPLLQSVIDGGDDLQREMAEAYLMQLSELMPASDIVEDSLVAAPVSEDLAIETSAIVDVVDDELLFVDVDDEVSLDESAEVLSNISLPPLGQPFNDTSVSSDKPMNVEAIESPVDVRSAVHGVSSGIKTDIVGQADAGMVGDTVSDRRSADGYLHQTAEVSGVNQLNELENKVSNEVQSECEIALEQVALLMDDDELETAQMLLGPVLSQGNADQRQLANDYLRQIEDLLDKRLKDENHVSGINETQDTTAAIPPVITRTVDETPYQQSIDTTITEPMVTAQEDGLEENNGSVKDKVKDKVIDNSFEIGHSLSAQLPDADVTQSLDSLGETQAIDLEDSGLLLPSDALGQGDDLSLLEQQQGSDDLALDKEHRQGFYVGKIALMIRYIDGSELTEVPTLYQLPSAPNWFIGLANLHGKVIPVIDLAVYFGISQEKMRKPMLLVLDHEENATGVIIDGLPNRLIWDAKNKVDNNIAPDYLRDYIKAVCNVNNEIWFDFDVTVLIEELERSMC